MIKNAHLWMVGPGYIEEDDPRYLVFLTLIHRAKKQGQWQSDRLEPTPREFAIFEHGDQCRIDGVCWRITAKNVEKGVLFVRGWQAGLSIAGRLVTANIEENLANRIADRNKSDALREKEYQARYAKSTDRKNCW